MSFKYIFGPVISRRLGISLGVDLVPHKTCSLDCVYCECGRTTQRTVQPGELVPTADVLRELEGVLSRNPKLDFVTFSGSGEPTLHSGLGQIILFLKNNYPPYRTALLTNGVHFPDSALRQRVLPFDVIVPSLDAVSQPVFERVNRGCPQLHAAEIVDGLVLLRKEFTGELWLEIFIIPGINDTPEELALLKAAAERIQPNRIQFNSLDRPGTEAWVKPASKDRLREIVEFFGRGEIVAKPPREKTQSGVSASDNLLRNEILATIRRRPSTVSDLSISLKAEAGRIEAILGDLSKAGCVTSGQQARGTFFRAV